MANKRVKEEREKIERERKFRVSYKKTMFPFFLIVLGLCVLLMICFFFEWVYVYNRSYGTEVKVSGWSFIAAALSGKYSSADKVYGDLAAPFYYYAKAYCKPLGVLSLLSMIFIVAVIVVQILSYAFKNFYLSCAAAVSALVPLVLLSVSLGIALAMKNSNILPIYCSGNPECSIRSSIFFPLAVALAVFVLSVWQCVLAKKVFRGLEK